MRRDTMSSSPRTSRLTRPVGGTCCIAISRAVRWSLMPGTLREDAVRVTCRSDRGEALAGRPGQIAGHNVGAAP